MTFQAQRWSRSLELLVGIAGSQNILRRFFSPNPLEFVEIAWHNLRTSFGKKQYGWLYCGYIFQNLIIQKNNIDGYIGWIIHKSLPYVVMLSTGNVNGLRVLSKKWTEWVHGILFLGSCVLLIRSWGLITVIVTRRMYIHIYIYIKIFPNSKTISYSIE